MQKRIFLTFAGLVLACVVLLAVSFGLLFFNAARRHEQTAIRDKAHLVAALLNQDDDIDLRTIDSGGSRFTVIAPDGLARFDSHRGVDLSTNRSNRAEFAQALQHGIGEAIRPSETLGTDTFYFAIRLDNGDVLRLSRTLYSLGAGFRSMLPALAVILLAVLGIAYGAAHRLTRLIIKPITQMDLDAAQSDNTLPQKSQYEELWPFIKKIEHQRTQINHQLTTLLHRAETIEAIIANMREGLVILDENGTILSANKSAAKIFGMKKKRDLLHRSIGHLYRDATFTRNVQACLGGAFTEMDITRNGKHYNAFFSPVAQNGTPNGAILFFLDTTAHHKANQQRRAFTANVSHELKTPLTTVAATAEMIANGMAQPEDIRPFAHKILEQTHRLMNTINEIIRLSEFDESKVERDFAPIDLHALAARTLAVLQDKAIEKSVTLDLVGTSTQINANAHLLDELLSNLIDNAIKYNHLNGRVTVEIARNDNECVLTVTDTGIGIPKDHQRRIFERFYRVDASRSNKTGGTGLGLSIVKHITEHHGGTTQLESTPEVGTTVICRFPI
ncbi:MAG: ATP-binding protein [Defluviitaleaceae bacterium]|nr:ATP-binding protein [Defluviitaleaceae bacterium]